MKIKVLIVIAAVLAVMLGGHRALVTVGAVELAAMAAGCCLVARKIRLTGWVIPRGVPL